MRERSLTDFERRSHASPGSTVRRSATVICPSIEIVEGVLHDMVLESRGKLESYCVLREEVQIFKDHEQYQGKKVVQGTLPEHLFEEECQIVKEDDIPQKNNSEPGHEGQEQQQQQKNQIILITADGNNVQGGTEAEDEQKLFVNRSPRRPESCSSSVNRFEHVHKPLKDLIYKTNKEFYDVDSHKVKYKAGLSKRSAMLPSLHRKKKPLQ